MTIEQTLKSVRTWKPVDGMEAWSGLSDDKVWYFVITPLIGAVVNMSMSYVTLLTPSQVTFALSLIPERGEEVTQVSVDIAAVGLVDEEGPATIELSKVCTCDLGSTDPLCPVHGS